MKYNECQQLEYVLTKKWYNQVEADLEQWCKDLACQYNELIENEKENKEAIEHTSEVIQYVTFLYDDLSYEEFLTIDDYNKYVELKSVVALSEKNDFTHLNRIVVHDGVFHCDDVMCVALAKHLNTDIEIIRTSEQIKINEYLKDSHTAVCDIGFGIMDHHQENVELRTTDGEKRAACGLFAERIWEYILPDYDAWKHLNWNFIIPIENADNFGETNPLTSIITNCRPVWDAPNYSHAMELGFQKAVDKLYADLSDFIESERARIRGEATIFDAVMKASNKQAIVLDKYCPWGKEFEDTNVKYVIYPNLRGGYAVQTVQKNYATNQKDTFPKEWLKEPPVGCTFVHNDLFFAAFDTEENAIHAVNILIGKV